MSFSFAHPRSSSSFSFGGNKDKKQSNETKSSGRDVSSQDDLEERLSSTLSSSSLQEQEEPSKKDASQISWTEVECVNVFCVDNDKPKAVSCVIRRRGRTLMHIEIELAFDRIFETMIEDPMGFQIKVVWEALKSKSFKSLRHDPVSNVIELDVDEDVSSLELKMREVTPEMRKEIEAKELDRMKREIAALKRMVTRHSLLSVFGGARVISHPTDIGVLPDWHDQRKITCVFPGCDHPSSGSHTTAKIGGYIRNRSRFGFGFEDAGWYHIVSDPIVVKLAHEPIMINRVLVSIKATMLSHQNTWAAGQAIGITVETSTDGKAWSQQVGSHQVTPGDALFHNSFALTVPIFESKAIEPINFIRMYIVRYLPQIAHMTHGNEVYYNWNCFREWYPSNFSTLRNHSGYDAYKSMRTFSDLVKDVRDTFIHRIDAQYVPDQTFE